MAKKPQGPQAVTANRLSDGLVVYLAEDGEWVETLDGAAVAASADAAARLLEQGEQAAAAAQRVVAPYLMDVINDGGGVRAARYREIIRALGPTVRRDLGKQAGFQLEKE